MIAISTCFCMFCTCEAMHRYFANKLLCERLTLIAKINSCTNFYFGIAPIILNFSEYQTNTEIAMSCTDDNVGLQSLDIILSLKPFSDSQRHCTVAWKTTKHRLQTSDLQCVDLTLSQSDVDVTVEISMLLF